MYGNLRRKMHTIRSVLSGIKKWVYIFLWKISDTYIIIRIFYNFFHFPFPTFTIYVYHFVPISKLSLQDFHRLL